MRFNSEYGCKNTEINQSFAHLIEVNEGTRAKIILFYQLDYIRRTLCNSRLQIRQTEMSPRNIRNDKGSETISYQERSSFQTIKRAQGTVHLKMINQFVYFITIKKKQTVNYSIGEDMMTFFGITKVTIITSEK